MVCFTEKLIHEIRKRSCIWDTADVNHLNKNVLTNMWMEIAENLYPDWHALSAFDKRNKAGDVKKKWTNIKDSFVKDVKGNKPRKSRGPPEHWKKYYLFDHLQFLIPFIQDSGESKKRARKGLGEGSSWSHTPPGSSTAVAAKPGVATAAVTAPRPDALPNVQQHADLLNNIAGKSAADALCQLDGDLSFMVSLLPTVKSMNEKQKINFKIGVLQLLARIKFNDVLQENQADAAAAYQPFATSDLRFLGPAVTPYGQHYQPHVPITFVNHQHQQRHHRQSSSSSSAAQHYKRGSTAATPPVPVKQETVKSSPATTSSFENSDHEDYDDASDANNN